MEINVWITNKKFTLLYQDRDILLNPAGWLNASIISAAQIMLKEYRATGQVTEFYIIHTYTGGLQDPCLGNSMAFKVESGSLVQILYNGHGHWLTITNIGTEGEDKVLVYGNLYPSVSTCINKQIAALLHSRIGRSE